MYESDRPGANVAARVWNRGAERWIIAATLLGSASCKDSMGPTVTDPVANAVTVTLAPESQRADTARGAGFLPQNRLWLKAVLGEGGRRVNAHWVSSDTSVVRVALEDSVATLKDFGLGHATVTATYSEGGVVWRGAFIIEMSERR